MGNIFTADGIRPDPDKVTAITDMRRPDNEKAVQKFIGLATYLSRFMPHISETCEPLRRLTDKRALWSWQSQQEEAFQSVKRLVSRQPVLKGKELYIADTLSRATPEYHGKHPSKLAEEIAQIQHADWVRKITDSRLNQIRDLTNKDDSLQPLKTVILSGWPDTKDDVPIAIRPYWNVKDTLTVQDGIIYHSSRVII
uniref:Reverse transcriptase/retrotransposon-derived protein RNase H-like domain-containing protein n=1 Tax=Magallana gigas TaxID=29159 RepID=A0A8W8KNA1_MAGGI